MISFFKFILRVIDRIFRPLGVNLKSFFSIYFLKQFNPKYSNEHNFKAIYKSKKWLKFESLSGSGSDIKKNTIYRKELNDFFMKEKIKSLCDIPCGDMNWMSEFLKDKNIEYLGGDIVNFILKKNKIKYPKYKFLKIDLIKNIIKKKFDVLHIKDLFFHLSYKDLEKVIMNIKQYNYKFLIITNHESLISKNYDINSGDFRILDLRKSPFFFPKPYKKIRDFNFGEFPKFSYVYKKIQISQL